ncbi:MAG: phage portal protein, partial [Vagococcus sp.]
NLPPAMIGGTGNSMTYTNVQDTQLQFLQTTIEPYLTIIENTFNKYLLTEKEKLEGYYFEFDTINMLRTTPARQIEMLSRATGGKQFMAINEARNEMNLPPQKGGDVIDFSVKDVKGGEKRDGQDRD